jgi:hypothetical protein
MSKDEMIACVSRQLDCYNRRDLDGFCACFHADVRVDNLVSGPGPRGSVEFRSRYQGIFASSPALKGELRSRLVLDSFVVDEEWVTGSSAFPAGIHTVAIYAFRDGLIDRVWFAR